MSWKDDKDLGSWEFSEQQNKWGYLNNPRWSSKTDAKEFSEASGNSIDPTYTHVPCGHWHKETEVGGPIVTTEAIWQQSLDVLKSEELLGIAGMSTDSELKYLLYITDLDGNVETSHLWETDGDVSGLPGTINIIKISGVPTVFYHNWNYDENSDENYWVYKLDANGNYYSSLVFESEYTDGSNYQYMGFTWGMGTMAISTSGIIVTAISIVREIAGVDSNYIHTIRSTDWGVTWEDAVEISIDGLGSAAYIECDSSGNFWITTNDQNDVPDKPFRLWKSTDNGASWVEISTVPSTPILRGYNVVMSISGTKIYVACRTYSGGYTNRIWSSIDGGVNWVAGGAPAVAGETYLSDYDIEANNDVVVMACVGGTTDNSYIIRSDDAGATWSTIGQRGPTPTWSTYIEENDSYITINNDDDMFVFTSCGDYILGTNYLGYLFSDDDGLTWEAKALPLSIISGVPSYGAIPTLPDEPQVWPMD